MKILVFNGWAAGVETWALCAFPHDWVFDYVEQLDGLPEKIIEDFDEVVLVGFSMGGSTALRMWLKWPEKVKGLVLISTTPCMMEVKHRDTEAQRTDDTLCLWDSVLKTGYMGDWKGMSERRLAALRLGTKMMFKDDPSPMYDERNMERGLEYLRKTDLRGELLAQGRKTEDGRREMPVWIFQSERDGIVRPSNAAFLKEVFPQAKVTMVPGNEHVLPIRVPELIDAAVFDVSSVAAKREG